jgi:lipoprotein-anchoring transpeptidase ErfK/SrfK
MNDAILRALPRADGTSAPAASASPTSGARKRSAAGVLAGVLLGGAVCMALLVAVLLLSSSPVMASMLAPVPQSTPTRDVYFVQSDLRMPTLTPTVTPLPPTPTPGVMEMSLVNDTPVPETDVPGQAPAASSGGKYILVDISDQHMYVYEGDTLIWSWVASTGMNNATAVGTFAVQSKIPDAYGATWDIWMPNWLGIYWSGGLENGIHALPILPSGARLWAGFLGRPISYGCVVLGEYESELLYNWAEIGTPVEIRR